MGEQLDLFSARPSTRLAVVPAAGGDDAPTPVAGTDAPIDLAGQMDLFGDRWLRAAAAHKALETFDLDAASIALCETVKLYPSDTGLAERATRITELAAALREATATTHSEAAALAAIELKVPPYLSNVWHLRLAAAIEHEPGATLDGCPAGLHYLRGGALERAEQSLRASLAQDAFNARTRAYLGDALFALGRRANARIEYREALASDPSAVDLANLLDEAVRDLSDVAAIDHEVSGDPVEWIAAMGLIEGVFVRPLEPPPAWFDATAVDGAATGVRFYRWLVVEMAAKNGDERLAARRAMKALSPGLLKAVLARRG